MQSKTGHHAVQLDPVAHVFRGYAVHSPGHHRTASILTTCACAHVLHVVSAFGARIVFGSAGRDSCNAHAIHQEKFMNTNRTNTLIRTAGAAILALALAACGKPAATTTATAARTADTNANSQAALAYVDPMAGYKAPVIRPGAQ